ncbi:RNA-guided endonuclease IscB (plasmid) [Cetobacterium somerae]|uniref:RNA-guided endonuclease IscB n=1 Tax=Cetobacterium somerae TaxID=188913 RepID=UPI002E7ABE4D|nr:RNA-guided endonuclease IscB [Cetobacterium somerae]WVJ03084.1 RNA-guided endonuclease IscB [Cetobacterium somerae]
MRVFVINKRGQALMPCSTRKARLLLKEKKAKIFKYEPFTIQLNIATGEIKQEIILGIDSGYKNVGISATTEKKELYSAEITLRTDIVDLLSSRRSLRKTRRGRKTRYRKARFLNRIKSKKKGWLAPSVENKIETHLRIIKKILNILPISKIIIETAQFDIQKIKNPDISGIEYQNGEQLNFWNIREYVLFRDNHICQNCKGKTKDKILNVHHIESRKVGGNAPNNLITLCETCHNNYHSGKIELKIKRGKSFKEATFMGVMRWTLYNRLKAIFNNTFQTYGYLTKNKRIENNLPKSHRVDAYCIAGNLKAKKLDCYYLGKQVRKNNRQIHKMTINKGGTRKVNQSPYLVKGFRLFDKVRYRNIDCFIFGRRSSGSFDIRKLNGEKNSAGISFKKLKLLDSRKTIITEVIISIPPLPK